MNVEAAMMSLPIQQYTGEKRWTMDCAAQPGVRACAAALACRHAHCPSPSPLPTHAPRPLTLSRTSRSAPALSSSRTMSASPLSTATWSGVLPSCDVGPGPMRTRARRARRARHSPQPSCGRRGEAQRGHTPHPTHGGRGQGGRTPLRVCAQLDVLAECLS